MDTTNTTDDHLDNVDNPTGDLGDLHETYILYALMSILIIACVALSVIELTNGPASGAVDGVLVARQVTPHPPHVRNGGYTIVQNYPASWYGSVSIRDQHYHTQN
jgi:hypothetical protein